jgi:hypothetical protein
MKDRLVSSRFSEEYNIVIYLKVLIFYVFLTTVLHTQFLSPANYTICFHYPHMFRLSVATTFSELQLFKIGTGWCTLKYTYSYFYFTTYITRLIFLNVCSSLKMAVICSRNMEE